MKLLIFILITIGIISGISLGLSNNISAEENSIPSWVKKSAEWWVDGSIGDADFIKSLEFLIKEEIITIPKTQSEDGSYMTYFSENDGYQIKIPSYWMASEYDYNNNQIQFVNTNPDSSSGESITISVSDDSHNELDDFIDDSLKPYLVRTATDLEIIDEKWTNHNDRVPFGYEITYTQRTGINTVTNSLNVVLENNILYTILYSKTGSNSSVDPTFIFDSFQAGTQIGYGEGYVFGLNSNQRTASSNNSEFFDVNCSSGYNIIKYNTDKYGKNTYHDADKNQNGYYCGKYNDTTREMVYTDD